MQTMTHQKHSHKEGAGTAVQRQYKWNKGGKSGDKAEYRGT